MIFHSVIVVNSAKAPKYKGTLESLLKLMSQSVVKLKKIMISIEGQQDPSEEPNNDDQMMIILRAAKKEARERGITDRDEIQMMVLQKENEFMKDHLKEINTLISQYIDKTMVQPTKKAAKVIDLVEEKQKRISGILDKQISTAKKQIQHLSTEFNNMIKSLK